MQIVNVFENAVPSIKVIKTGFGGKKNYHPC